MIDNEPPAKVDLNGKSLMTRKGKQEQRMDDIADVALALLKQRGQLKFSLAEVGKIGNTTPGSLYRLFSSKEDLLVYIFTRQVKSMVAINKGLLKQGLSATEYLACTSCFPHYLATLRANPSGLDFVSTNPLLLERVTPKFLDELSRQYQLLAETWSVFFDQMVSQGKLMASPEQVQGLNKRLAILGRGVSVVANHTFMPASTFPLDECLDFAVSVIHGFNWQEQERRADKRLMLIAMRSVSDRDLTLNF